MKDIIATYWSTILFLVPLGVVGVWRWSVWAIKKVISFFYRSPKGNFYSTLSIVTPVYNEDPDMFRLALESWRLNEPDEIIAVIDHSNPELIAIFNHFSGRFAGARLLVTQKPGKRSALADGIAVSKSEIVALVDSDTIWGPKIKRKFLAPFSDPKLGGLTTRQDVLKTDTFARKLFKILLDDRYLTEYPFLTVVSDALLCLSGRTAVYRRAAIEDKLEALVNEKFWGKQMISGDDKTLTNLVHLAGWKTCFLRDVKVYTPGNPELMSFIKQKLRWARNGLRSDLKILFGSWVWKKHKILALVMIEKVIAAITILLGPAYFVVSLLAGHWEISAIILVWWLVSRAIKILPHLKEKPADILILPAYVLMTFVMAIVKIYAFFTMDKQGWITRWDASRLNVLGPFRQVTAIALTVFFVGGYFLTVGSYQQNTLESAIVKSSAQKSSKNKNNVISTQPKLVSDAELLRKKVLIQEAIKKNAYGFFAVRPGDTLLAISRKFNMKDISQMTYENNIPIANVNSIPIGKKIMIPVSALQNSLSVDNLPAVTLSTKPSVISYDQLSNTIFVKGGGSVVTLPKIKASLFGNKKILEEIKPGEWILRANLYIGKDVTLVVDKRDTTYLKLKSDNDGFVWVLSQGGNMFFSQTKVTSWDESKSAPDTDHAQGRSHITAKSSGRMDIVNSEIAYLGYAGLPERGGPFGGSYGLSWKITSGEFNDNLLTGSVINSSIHDNYFGIYTFGATGVMVKGNKVFQNVEYGIDPHDDSNNMIISDNIVFENGNHGIITSKRCFGNQIYGNVSHNNKLHGIMLDRNSENNVVEMNTVYGNVDGISLYDSNENLISRNNIHGNKQGIRLNQNSSFNFIESNQIISNGNGVHVYGGANKNVALNNNIASNDVGISIQNASGNMFYASLKHSENTKDGNIETNENENEIK
ncbi:MAG: hypothetical protein ACD_8C00068G0008 [uncultured bacterium]|nr:MAG: hypothetical protein ACD_8C00068G0008 [uncultured bacterium]